MWMRIAGAIAVAGLACVLVTCGGDMATSAGGDTASQDPDPVATATGTPTPGATGTTPAQTQSIACAIGPSAGFDSTCSVERTVVDGTTLLAVFHPDGGFRRFELLSDGSGLAAVAGADTVSQTLDGDTLEIAIAGNRYRFPAAAQ